MPKFTEDCLQAFEEMNTQDSPNDFFVAGLEDSEQVSLVEKGRGGMARVKEILLEQFASRTAVAVFRITAVDDRTENTVSYRTKLVHVIYTGPKTPVMKRAKVGSYNAVFKEKFSCNMYIQTDDCEGDLNEQQLERNLRLSGGAHAPNRYDFTNSSTLNFFSREEIMARHERAFDAKDIMALGEDYTESSQVIFTQFPQNSTNVYQGISQIRSFFEHFLTLHGDHVPVIFDGGRETDDVTWFEWSNSPMGIISGLDTFVLQRGKIMCQTVVIVWAQV